jgi:uncharacterized membrane protein YgcG
LLPQIAFPTRRGWFEIAAVLSFGICLLSPGLQRRYRQTFVSIVALLAIATAVACGGGNTSGSGSGSGSGGGNGSGSGGGGGNTTPPGTYNGVTLDVAVSGISQFVYVNVNVQ